MIAIKRECLNQDELQRVIAGRMEQGAFDSALSHLDDCDECRAAAETLQQDGDWIVQALSSDQADDPLQAETACQVALWRMMETPAFAPAAVAASSAPRESLGPYRFIRALGTGGMGTVYLAEHDRLRRQCAVKLLPRERVDQPGWLDRFDREMTTVASLDHPNVVQATDAGQEDGWHYLVMEFLDGLDVGRIAGRMGTIEVADACEIVRQAAQGLAHVHAAGLVHRDIKPSNLMLTTGGTVKLLDLGLVLSGDDPLAIDDRLTTVGHLMGTMPYMAPEQLVDSRDVDPRADIYSLGATLYRLIAGAPPHPTRRGLAAHVLAITNDDAPALDSVRDDVNDEVVALVGEMLARDPEQRPQSAADVAQRLENIGNGGQLKRLLREAMRRSSDTERPATFSASLAGQAESPPNNRWRKWLAAAMGGFFFFLAVVTIIIQTDRGDLVVRSEHDGLTIKIKQQDEVVETLRIEASGDNRITLHKGSYVLDIEGGSDDLKLSHGVVTIGRGEETPVTVESAVDSTKWPQDPGPLYNGDPIAHWQDAVRRETDMEAIGEAMAGIATLAVHEDSDGRRSSAKAMLESARKFGGSKKATPPSRGSSGFAITESEHFMWYFLDAFPATEPSFAVEAIAAELSEGNGRSRAAALRALDAYSWSRIQQPGLNVAGRFQLKQLFFNCQGLLDESRQETIWNGLPEDGNERSIAIGRAFRWWLRLALFLDMEPESIGLIAKSFHRDEASVLTLAELTAQVDIIGRRGSLQRLHESLGPWVKEDFPAQPKSNAPKPDQPSKSAAADSSPLADPTAAVNPASSGGHPSNVMLFQGKNLDHWMGMLTREQDPAALGQAMSAVETLTRDSEDRKIAAEATLRTARHWGGFVSSGTTVNNQFGGDRNPSHRYMGFLLEVFPAYLPDDGIGAIATELEHGTDRSRMAAIWLLGNYLSGNTIKPPGHKFPGTWISEFSQGDDGAQALRALLGHLEDAVSALNGGDLHASGSAEMGRKVGLKLQTMAGRPVTEQAWLTSYAKAQLDSAKAYFANAKPSDFTNRFSGDGGGFGGNPGVSWLLDLEMVEAALDLAEADQYDVQWDLIAACVMHPRSVVWLSDGHAVFDYTVENGPAAQKSLLDAIQRQLDAIGDSDAIQPLWHPTIELGNETSVWPKALPWYAEHCEDAMTSVSLLNTLRGIMKNNGATNFEIIDSAIATLKARAEGS